MMDHDAVERTLSFVLVVVPSSVFVLTKLVLQLQLDIDTDNFVDIVVLATVVVGIVMELVAAAAAVVQHAAAAAAAEGDVVGSYREVEKQEQQRQQ